MSEHDIAQNTLRDTLTESFEQAEAGTLPTAEERARDEAGRFAKQEQKVEKPQVQKPEPEQVEQPEVPQRPTTWKKDYLPIWDKLATGQALTPDEAKKLAKYTEQRENEYKTGVSTYKTEAQNARELQEAVVPYSADLQASGLTPATWIKQVGQAHTILLRGTPEQKLSLLHGLARQYGVPLQAVAAYQPGQQVPPILAQILQPMGDMRSQLQELSAKIRRQEQEALDHQLKQMEVEVNQFASDQEKYPHFEAVREDMARLLEAGVARDLPTAYKMAVRTNDDLHQAELDRIRSEKQASKSAVVSKARAQAVSPKSATPSGQVATSGAKDRRATLSDAFDAVAGGRV